MGENSLSVTGNVTVTAGRTMVITNVGKITAILLLFYASE